MDKSPDAFRTISEVAADLDLPQHVLRFWETRFVQIKPLKRGGGRRYYRPDDVDLLKGIRHLLYGEGYTIRGVQRILKEQGVRFVMEVWQEGAPQPPTVGRWEEEPRHAPVEDWAEDWAARGADDTAAPDDAPHWPPATAADAAPPDEPARIPDGLAARDRPDGGAPAAPIEPSFVTPVVAPRAPAAPHALDLVPEPSSPRPFDDDRTQALAQRFAPVAAVRPIEPRPPEPRPPEPRLPEPRAPEPPAAPRPPSPRPSAQLQAPTQPQAAAARPLVAEPLRPMPNLAPDGQRAGFGQFLDRLRPHAAPAPAAPPPAAADTGRAALSLSRDDVRRLQATLFELLECKRLLDQVR